MVKLDISGPNGTSFYILATVKQVLESIPESELEAIDTLATLKEITPVQYVLEDLENTDDYEKMLITYLEYFPFVKFISTRGKLDWIDDDSLYTIEDDQYL